MCELRHTTPRFASLRTEHGEFTCFRVCRSRCSRRFRNSAFVTKPKLLIRLRSGHYRVITGPSAMRTWGSTLQECNTPETHPSAVVCIGIGFEEPTMTRAGPPLWLSRSSQAVLDDCGGPCWRPRSLQASTSLWSRADGEISGPIDRLGRFGNGCSQLADAVRSPREIRCIARSGGRVPITSIHCGALFAD